MSEKEFYDYIMESFNLGGTSSRLVSNIIEYVKDQGFVDAEDAHAHLKSLLDGAFGIKENEIELYRAPDCGRCGKYTTDYFLLDDDTLTCIDCVKSNDSCVGD